MQVIERIEGHYEAQDVEFGRVYRWRAPRVDGGALVVFHPPVGYTVACQEQTVLLEPPGLIVFSRFS